MKELLGVGAPVYWVTKGPLDYFNKDIRERICGSSDCSPHSIGTQLYLATTQPQV